MTFTLEQLEALALIYDSYHREHPDETYAGFAFLSFLRATAEGKSIEEACATNYEWDEWVARFLPINYGNEKRDAFVKIPFNVPQPEPPLLQCADCRNTESPAGAMARQFNHGRCLHCGGYFKVVRA